MANQRENIIVERRKEVMTSFLGSHVQTRFGHFLIPSVISSQGAAPDFPNNSIYSPNPNPQTGIQVHFKGWKRPERKCINWYEQMQPICQPIWERAGIQHALKNSTYYIQQNEDLILAFAERWCPSTQSVVFPWGESTITLEDVMILGGYPILGTSILGDDSRSMDDAIRNMILEQNRQMLTIGHA